MATEVDNEVPEKLSNNHPLFLNSTDNLGTVLISLGIVYSSSSSAYWSDLKERFDKIDRSRIFQMQKQIAIVTQGASSIATYFSKLRQLWDEFDALTPSPYDFPRSHDYVEFMKRQKLLQFLIGLNESNEYAHSQILMMIHIPNVNKAYSMLTERECQRSMMNTLGIMDNVEMNALMITKGRNMQQVKRNYNLQCDFC
ncbi:uncharacterized protein [Nicotiana tomentosiformis]|uniref:uncharacterized protein n=1 Tax=Nicotiana tomentosiformis TaxID=4098 RepID=UPI00388CE005